MHQADSPVSPWQRRGELPRIAPGRLVGAAAVGVLCALSLGALPLFSNLLPMLLLVVLSAYVVISVRHPGTVAFLLIAVFAVSLFAGYLITAYLLALVVGIGSLSWLITVTKKGYLFLLLPPVAALALLILTGDPLLSARVLLPLPAGALMAYATCREKGRTTVVVYAQLGLLLSLVIAAMCVVYQMTGAVTPTAISTVLETLRASSLEGLIALREEVIGLLQGSLSNASGEDPAELVQSLQTSFNDTFLGQLVSLAFNLAPGIAAMLCGVVAFLSQMYLCGAYYACGWRRVLTPSSCTFTMSVSAAVIYFIGFLFVLFDSSGSMPAVVMENLCLVLLPGLCVIGVASFRYRLHASKGGTKVFWAVILFLLVCCSGASAFFLLGLWGSNTVVMQAINKRLRKHVEGEDRGDRDR